MIDSDHLLLKVEKAVKTRSNPADLALMYQKTMVD